MLIDPIDQYGNIVDGLETTSPLVLNPFIKYALLSPINLLAKLMRSK